MAYKPWSVVIAWLVTLGLFGVASFGRVDGTPLLVLVAVALTVPALVLTDSADATPLSHGEPTQLRDVGGAIPAPSAA